MRVSSVFFLLDWKSRYLTDTNPEYIGKSGQTKTAGYSQSFGFNMV